MPVSFELAAGVGIGPAYPLLLVAGPCVIEGEDMLLEVAGRLKELAADADVGFVFKASFDKANRTALASYRGPGIDEGLRMLGRVRKEASVPVLTDVHEPPQVGKALYVADVLQVPAFLCRQTDLLLAAGRSGKPVNIKKGQFMAPEMLAHSADKVRSTGNRRVLLTERGTFFGYGDLVVDMRALATMRAAGWPVLFDATHSVQQPGGRGNASGGRRDMVRFLLRAACAAGVDGIFIETHPSPDTALSDGPNMVPLDAMGGLLAEACEFDALRRRCGAAE